MHCAADRGDRIRHARLTQSLSSVPVGPRALRGCHPLGLSSSSAIRPPSRLPLVDFPIDIHFRLCSSVPHLPANLTMFRVALIRTTAMGLARPTPALSARVVLPRLSLLVRYNSSKPPLTEKQQLEAQDDLRRDWDARILSYEELKPKTQQPSPVSRVRTLSS